MTQGPRGTSLFSFMGKGLCSGMKAIKKPDRQLMRIGLNQSVIKAGDALIMIFLNYSTVTDFAKLRGWSTSVPRNTAT